MLKRCWFLSLQVAGFKYSRNEKEIGLGQKNEVVVVVVVVVVVYFGGSGTMTVT